MKKTIEFYNNWINCKSFHLLSLDLYDDVFDDAIAFSVTVLNFEIRFYFDKHE